MLGTILYVIILILILIYGVLLLPSSIRFWHKPIVPPEQSDTIPFISVIIPARNEASSIGECLEALTKQFDRNGAYIHFEVIVIDDHSTDNTLKIAQANAGNLDIQFIRLPSGKQGKKAAITAGIAVARGEWIATTDADAIPSPLWLWTMAMQMQTGKTQMVIGPILTLGHQSLLTALQQIENCVLQGVSAGLMEQGEVLVSSGASLLYQKNLLKQTGGYEADRTPSGDDILLLLRTAKQYPRQISWVHQPQAIVHVQPVSRIRQFIAQRVRWASKYVYYRSFRIQCIGWLVIGLTFLSWITALLSLFGLPFWSYAGISLSGKLLVDFLLLSFTQSFFQQRSLLLWFWPAAFLYLLITPLIAIGAISGRFSWKDRNYRIP
jgi:cellulose synthase/poly-beta-1,6-N-acetylglucosamine synthase-like glycosyltransferase